MYSCWLLAGILPLRGPAPQSRDHEHLSCRCSQVSSDPRSSHLSSSRPQSSSSWNLLLRSSRATRSHRRPLRLGGRSGPADGPFPWDSLRGRSSSAGEAEVAFTGGFSLFRERENRTSLEWAACWRTCFFRKSPSCSCSSLSVLKAHFTDKSPPAGGAVEEPKHADWKVTSDKPYTENNLGLDQMHAQ